MQPLRNRDKRQKITTGHESPNDLPAPILSLLVLRFTCMRLELIMTRKPGGAVDV